VSVATDARGWVAPAFEAVAEAFRLELSDRTAPGASFAVTVDGRAVVELWGGSTDTARGTAWRADTIVPIFSGTKGLVAVSLLILLEREALELDAPVSRYWPEFAAAGKGEVTVAQVVSHTAGLPGLRDGFGATDLLDGERMRERVAAEAPFWEPGSTIAYHALTFGWVCDGLVRGVDGRSLGRFFSDEVAGPLGLDLWIGLPAELEPRVARVVRSPDYAITYLGEQPEPLLEAVYGTLASASFPWNEAEIHQAEIPGANAIGNARSIARLYGCLACGGELDGVRLLSEPTIRLGARELARGACAITQRAYAFGIGFELQTSLERFGPAPGAFGHTGSGGSVHGCWPTERVGFSYAMGELRPEASDGRARRLLEALRGCLA
jgi:CubicO group peptidase (beta-lactamase class C family)